MSVEAAILPNRRGVLGSSERYCSGAGRSCWSLLLLLPAALWLGIVYVGSLLALLLQSFFHIDDFSGLDRPRSSRSRPMPSCSSRRTPTSSSAR